MAPAAGGPAHRLHAGITTGVHRIHHAYLLVVVSNPVSYTGAKAGFSPSLSWERPPHAWGDVARWGLFAPLGLASHGAGGGGVPKERKAFVIRDW